MRATEVTDAQIRALRNEACSADDLAQVVICDRALGWSSAGYRPPTGGERVAVILARAMSRRAAIAECARAMGNR